MNIGKEDIAPTNGTLPARDIAAGIAVTLLLFFSVLFIPIMGFFVGIFTPLPTLLAFYRWGSPLGYLIPGGTAVLGLLFLSSLNMAYNIPYLLEMLILGLVLGMGMRKRWSIEKTIGSGSLLVFGMGALFFWIMNAGHTEILTGLEKDLHQTLLAMLQQYGVGSPEKELLEKTLDRSISVMVRLIPGVALSSTLIASWLNTLVAVRFCRSHHLGLPTWVDWARWKTPESLVWVVIASGFFILMPVGALNIVGQNALLVLATIYLFQGLAILAFYLERWKIPRILRGILYGFLFLQLFATLGATLMGLFDVWFDFRRLSRKPADSLK